MNQRNLLLYGSIVILMVVSWFAYQKVTDDTYDGMSTFSMIFLQIMKRLEYKTS